MQFVTQCMYSVSVSFYNFYTCNLHHDTAFFISFGLTSGQTWRPLELCACMVCLCVYVGMWYARMFTRKHGHAWTFCSCHRNARAYVWPLIYSIYLDVLVCDGLCKFVQPLWDSPTHPTSSNIEWWGPWTNHLTHMKSHLYACVIHRSTCQRGKHQYHQPTLQNDKCIQKADRIPLKHRRSAGNGLKPQRAT